MFELYSSVAVVPEEGGGLPPKPSAADCVPAPPSCILAVAKVAGDVVQLIPSHSSVAEVPPVPAKTTPTVCIPAAASPYLPVFKLFTAVQEDPLYDSQAFGVGVPPAAIAAV